MTACQRLLLLLMLAVALPLISARGLFESSPYNNVLQRSTPVKRLLSGYLCETVAVNVPVTESLACTVTTPATAATPAITTCTNTTLNVHVADNVCLCISGGLLTDASAQNLHTTVRNNGTAYALLTTQTGGTTGGIYGYTPDGLNAYLDATEKALLNKDSTDSSKATCNYPTGSTPNSCGSCSYTCPNGQVPCGTAAAPTCADTCQSGVSPFRRREYKAGETDFRCPKGYTACPLPGNKLNPYDGGEHECIDTQTDIESCGGCTFGLSSSQIPGTDCTGIAHSTGVGCEVGQCRVLTCEKGFQVAANGKSCEEAEELPHNIYSNGGALGQVTLGKKSWRDTLKDRQAKAADMRRRK